MNQVLEEEKKQAAEDRDNLLLQITSLIKAQAETQEKRLEDKTAMLRKNILESNATLEKSVDNYQGEMESWGQQGTEMLASVTKSRETLKNKLVDDWNVSAADPVTRNLILTEIRPPINTARLSKKPRNRSMLRRCASLTSNLRTSMHKWQHWTNS